MTDIPVDPKRIRARIRRYERKLQQERRELGGYHDGAGKRYFMCGSLLRLLGLRASVGGWVWA
jgi:hypothetical protein